MKDEGSDVSREELSDDQSEFGARWMEYCMEIGDGIVGTWPQTSSVHKREECQLSESPLTSVSGEESSESANHKSLIHEMIHEMIHD